MRKVDFINVPLKELLDAINSARILKLPEHVQSITFAADADGSSLVTIDGTRHRLRKQAKVFEIEPMTMYTFQNAEWVTLMNATRFELEPDASQESPS